MKENPREELVLEQKQESSRKLDRKLALAHYFLQQTEKRMTASSGDTRGKPHTSQAQQNTHAHTHTFKTQLL